MVFLNYDSNLKISYTLCSITVIYCIISFYIF